MSIQINSQNLDEVIQNNKYIKEKIELLRNNIIIEYNNSGVTGQEKLSFNILKEYHLIQLPIDDKYWGGAIITKGNLKIPVINTAQPRVNQYFTAWHEVYHLLYDMNLKEEMHNISTDMELNERMADYFAASMILGNTYNYYYSLDDENFIDRIMKCMDVYKAPYKAVLVQLYEDAALKYNDVDLKEKVLMYFDKKPSNLKEYFEKLKLDSELVVPSLIVSFGGLNKVIEKKFLDDKSVTYHEDNYKFLMNLEKKVIESIGGFKGER